MAPFPGNPSKIFLQPERPENKNAGDSRRREWLKHALKGSPKVIPHLLKENCIAIREIRRRFIFDRRDRKIKTRASAGAGSG